MEPKEETSDKKKPKCSFSVGRIKVAIWENGTSEKPWFKTEIVRRYEENGVWKSSHSYGLDDLLFVAKGADMAHDLVTKAKAQAAKRTDHFDEDDSV